MKPLNKHCSRGSMTARQRGGVILLVVLGMLTLFSMLAVSYLVFTARQRSAAASMSRAESTQVDSESLLKEALLKVLVGSDGPDSSLWGHDLLGDLYGMRDGIEGTLTAPGVFINNDVVPAALLDGNFLRFPTELYRSAEYPNRRADAATERNYPGPANPSFPIDDTLTGRLLTFEDGPLSGMTMSIARYFGDHTAATPARSGLSGQVVVDVRPYLQRTVEIDGVTRTLKEWIDLASAGSFSISRLFYDEYDPVAAAATARPLASFYINGRILNGPGLGWDVTRTPYDPMDATVSLQSVGGTPFNLNDVVSTTLDVVSVGGSPRTGTNLGAGGTDVPVSMQGHYALYRTQRNASTTGNAALDQYLQDLPPGDVDEPLDAPNFHDLWLSYFPGDPELGVAAPSFVRPALINWILNQKGDLAALSQPERAAILKAIERSTLRPLRIAGGGGGTGVLQLNYSEFTGSNTDSGLSTRLDPATVTAAQLQDLARGLAGRDTNADGRIDTPTWDVDTDGDGFVDSVFVDAGLSLSNTSDGRLFKPLVAYRIEDLGGRVNVNFAGNVAQAIDQIGERMIGPIQQRPSMTNSATPAAFAPTNPPVYIEDTFPTGFGYGPAEIDLRPIFSTQYATSNGPLALMSLRYNRFELASVPGDYYSPGKVFDTITASSNDLLGAFRHPTRQNLFSPANVDGLPHDPFGRGSVGLGVDGTLMVNRTSFPVQNTGASAAGASGGDINDDPYEFAATASTEPDAPLTYTDLEPVLRFREFDRDLLGSRLLNLINAYHNDPTAVPDQLEAVRRTLAESVTVSSNSAAVPIGHMPSEWRNNAIVAQSTLSPQSIFRPAITAADDSERNALLWQLIAPEVRAGGRFNLNRPFGNGLDDDSDGVIDDPQEIATTFETFFGMTPWQTTRGDITPGEPGRDSRSLFARHLYVMAMSLIRDANGNIDFDFPHNYSGTPSLLYGLTFEQEYRAWKVAQWAINVVDYRDPDAIMSRFNYDPNPFDGWDVVDATPGTYRTVWGMEYPELTLEESLAFHDRRVRDTADDTTAEKRLSGGTFRDDDPDQWRLPQGSLFLELRSTRSPQELLVAPTTATEDENAFRWSVPAELYSRYTDPLTSQEELALDLGREAPDQNPVWRIVISEIHNSPEPAARPELCPDFFLKPAGSITASDAAAAGVTLNRDTATLEPNQPDFFSAPAAGRVIDRVIWFTNRDPDSDGDGAFNIPVPADTEDVGQVFFNRFNNADYAPTTGGGVLLRGGQYAVVGPRTSTSIGSLEEHSAGGITLDAATNAPLVPYAQYESPHNIQVLPGAATHFNLAGNQTTPTIDSGAAPVAGATVQPVLGIVAAAKAPVSWGPATAQIGVNISEPIPWAIENLAAIPPRRYYDQPTESLDPTKNYPVDSWYDYDAAMGQLPDAPFDGQSYAELDRALGANAQNTGTRTHFKTAYLQRLADPTQPYHVDNNPYRTVDYIALDLTVFNGAMTNSQVTDSGGMMQWLDEADPDPLTSAPSERFATRYKTGSTWDEDATAAGAQFANLIHSINTYPPEEHNSPATNSGGNIAYFDRILHLDASVDPDQGGDPNLVSADRTGHSSTLGYLNTSFGERWAQDAGGGSLTMKRYVGLPFGGGTAAAGGGWGANVIWLNRDFVSPQELAWVPTSSAGRFAAEFGVASAASGLAAGSNPYDDSNNAMPNSLGRYDFNQQFSYLWNYLSSNANDFSLTPNFWRLLEWVEVPPPFDADVDFLSPDQNVLTNPAEQSIYPANFNYATFGANVTGDPRTWDATSPAPPGVNAFWLNEVVTETLRPPFNMRSPIYRSGMINLNTIKNKPVYQALMHGFSTPAERTAAGSGAFWDSFTRSRRGYASATGDAVGLGGQLDNRLNAYFPSQIVGAFKTPHAADIAPEFSPPAGATMPTPPSPMIRRTPIESTTLRKTDGADRMLFQRDPTDPAGPIRDSSAQSHERSVVHQQLGASRLANMASHQSNVFAVWVTVGMFEVDPSSLTVGQEVGYDVGRVERYRGFYIIDRSVPVMYRPGQKNNVEGVIQLSRVLN